MKYKNTLKLQEMNLRLAAGYAATILKCDEAIEVGNHVSYFKTVRDEAITSYADVVAEIVNASVDIAIAFSKPKFTVDDFMETVNTITEDYRHTHNITY